MKEGKDVLIIGAGLSGLVVAYQLEKLKIPYKLVEARERIGGRIFTIKSRSGAPIEMGATWFSSKHIHLMKLIDELNIPFENQYLGDKALYDYSNPKRIIEEISIPPSGEPSYIFSHGSFSLINALLGKLNSSEVYTREQVKSISFNLDKWKVITNSRKFETDIVINTLPPNLFVNAIKFTPGLPDELAKLSKSTHTWMGESIKVGIEYDEDIWRKKDVGTIFSQYGPIVELHDHNHSQNEAAVLMGFIDSHFHNLSSDEREMHAKKQLSMYFKESEDLISTYHELDWQNQKFTYHSYSNDIFPHQNNGHSELRKPYFNDTLFFACSETANMFPGYMDGAVERGLEVSKEIINLLKENYQFH